MKKYKLYKKNNLAKHVAIVNGNYRYLNMKLFGSAFVTYLAVDEIEKRNNIKENKLIFTVKAGLAIIMYYSALMAMLDARGIVNGGEKLRNLSSVLKKKGIFVDFFNNSSSYEIDDTNKYNSFINFINGDKIENYNNERILYVDSENSRELDITDEVNKTLLSKRKYKKYIKSKENDNTSKQNK